SAKPGKRTTDFWHSSDCEASFFIGIKANYRQVKIAKETMQPAHYISGGNVSLLSWGGVRMVAKDLGVYI
ncbi:MAG: hypothetical protein R6X09_03675, partial [Bacteroidales bacterium]